MMSLEVEELAFYIKRKNQIYTRV